MMTIVKATADKNPRGGYACTTVVTFDGEHCNTTSFGEHSIAAFLGEIFGTTRGELPIVNEVFINGARIPHYDLKKMMLRKLATARKTGRGSEYCPSVAITGIDAQYRLRKQA